MKNGSKQTLISAAVLAAVTSGAGSEVKQLKKVASVLQESQRALSRTAFCARRAEPAAFLPWRTARAPSRRRRRS